MANVRELEDFLINECMYAHYKKTTILRGPKTDAKVKKRTLMRWSIVRSASDEKSMEANTN